MATSRATLALIAIVLATACSGELSREKAAELILTHLQYVAPNVVHPESVHVLVEAITRPGEYDREVRWRWVSRGADSVPRSAQDTSGVLTVVMQRSDNGWVIARYGEAMTDGIANLMLAEWHTLYEDIVPIQDSIAELYDAWRSQITDRQLAALDAGRTSTYLRLSDLEKAGPDLRTIAAMVDSAFDLPPSLTWGYERPTLPSLYAPVLWVALADSLDVRCARMMDLASTRRPAGNDFYWLDEGWTTCEGRGETYSYSVAALDRAKERIRSSGGVYLR